MDIDLAQQTVMFTVAKGEQLHVSTTCGLVFTYDCVKNRAVEGKYHNYVPAGVVLEEKVIEGWLSSRMNPLMAAFIAAEIYSRCLTIHNVYMLIDEDYARWNMLAQMSGLLLQN